MPEFPDHEIRRLCSLVRDLPSDQRASVLDRECRADAGLKQVILAMIAAEHAAGPESHPTRTDHAQKANGASEANAANEAVAAEAARAAEAVTAQVQSSHASPTVVGDRPRFEHGRFEPGRLLGGRFRIVSLLGTGGMGEVYRADDLELGQPVALKLLANRANGQESWMGRLRSEVRTARQVTHPNVCRVHDIGEADGCTFLTMEYVDGDDLSSVLRRLGTPSREKTIEIARQICLGLAAAHEKGVLHRDLKPANIMIDGRGRVRITDFGLAGFVDEFEGVRTNAGTPAYMAPEQLAHGTVSVRSDIYSLGLILCELLTGKRVFETDDVKALKHAHSIGAATLPSEVTEDVDPALERVAMHCLQRRPEQRPQSVQHVLAALPESATPRRKSKDGILTKLCECPDRASLVRRRFFWGILAVLSMAGWVFLFLGGLGMAIASPRGSNSIGWVIAGMSLVLLALCGAFAALAFAQRLNEDRCQRCGYDLKGIFDNCPECGWRVSGSA